MEWLNESGQKYHSFRSQLTCFNQVFENGVIITLWLKKMYLFGKNTYYCARINMIVVIVREKEFHKKESTFPKKRLNISKKRVNISVHDSS